MALVVAAKRADADADLGAVGLSTRVGEPLRLRTMTDTVAQTILVRKL